MTDQSIIKEAMSGVLDSGKPRDIVQEALHSVRTHLGMEVAYLSEFVGDEIVFRAVDAPGLEDLIKPLDSWPVTEVYCKRILNGELPELIPNTASVPAAMDLPVTTQVPIGAHASVPIMRSDGTPYGMFCCLSPTPNASLNDRDLNVLRIFAGLAQHEVQNVLEARDAAQTAVDRISQAMEDRSFRIVFQPIHELQSRSVTGFEALCRFQAEPVRSPDQWFDEASGVGLGPDLEYCVLEATLSAVKALPEDMYLSVNAGPDLIASGRLREVFQKHDTARLVLEVTEHLEVLDYARLMRALAELREMGVKIAVDDAGAGYSGLQQLVRLRPDLIKLDRSLVTGIDTDPARRALCAAMVNFTQETDSVLIAEGIETEPEAEILQELGVHRGQGWLLGRPMSLDDALTHAGVCLGQWP